LKKWRPTTFPGLSVAAASLVIGIDDVLEARMASEPVTRSSSPKISFFRFSFSVAASMTSWRSPCSEISVEMSIRERMSSRPA
jgi:hypothetical protein